MQHDFEKIKKFILRPYCPLIINFLNEFSTNIRKHKDFKKFPDLYFLSLWTSKREIEKKIEYYLDKNFRLGRGLVFHVTPSNLPLNFAYSFFIGLLSGNSNIVKLPKKNFKEVEIVLDIINDLFKKKKFKSLKISNYFFNINDNSEIYKQVSLISDARMLWGGDNTINKFRKMEIPERCLDITFSDRYSIAVINSNNFVNLSNKDIEKMSKKFFYDSYLSNQMACNSPHFVFWIGEKSLSCQKKFWDNVKKIVQDKYLFNDFQIYKKYENFISNLISQNFIKSIFLDDNKVRILEISNKINNIENIRGIYGTFFQVNLHDINQLSKFITKKCQTVINFGFKNKKILDFIETHNLTGIDRIVEPGQAMNFNANWDSFNLINTLSRIIEVND